MKLWTLIAIVLTVILFAVVVYALRPKVFDPEDDTPFYLPTAYESKSDNHELLIVLTDDNIRVWRQGQLKDRPQFEVNHRDLTEKWSIVDSNNVSVITEPERLMCRMGINGYLRGPSGFELASYNAYLKNGDGIYWLSHEWGNPSPGTIRERFFLFMGNQVYASLYSTITEDISESLSLITSEGKTVTKPGWRRRFNHLVYYRPHGLRIATDDIAIFDLDSEFQCFSDTLGISGIIRSKSDPDVVNGIQYQKIEVEMWLADIHEVGHGMYIRDIIRP